MATLVIGGGAGEGVDTVVFGVTAMTFDPMPLDSVRLSRADQLLP